MYEATISGMRYRCILRVTGWAKFGYFLCHFKMVAPRALVFRPLIKGNEDSGNEIELHSIKFTKVHMRGIFRDNSRKNLFISRKCEALNALMLTFATDEGGFPDMSLKIPYKSNFFNLIECNVISLPEFFFKQKSKLTSDCCVFKFLQCSVEGKYSEKILCRVSRY